MPGGEAQSEAPRRAQRGAPSARTRVRPAKGPLLLKASKHRRPAGGGCPQRPRSPARPWSGDAPGSPSLRGAQPARAGHAAGAVRPVPEPAGGPGTPPQACRAPLRAQLSPFLKFGPPVPLALPGAPARSPGEAPAHRAGLRSAGSSPSPEIFSNTKSLFGVYIYLFIYTIIISVRGDVRA